MKAEKRLREWEARAHDRACNYSVAMLVEYMFLGKFPPDYILVAWDEWQLYVVLPKVAVLPTTPKELAREQSPNRFIATQ